MIDKLMDEDDAGGSVTFSALEVKLESLLQPATNSDTPFIPQVNVSIATAYNPTANLSDLEIDM
jgi:hypothetical protein